MSAGRRNFPFHECVYSCEKRVNELSRTSGVLRPSSDSRLSLHSWCSSPKCATWSLSVSRKVYDL